MILLSESNSKLKKGRASGWRTYGLSLLPSDLSGRDYCGHSSKGCREGCLNTAGRGVFPNVQAARMAKSLRFNEDRSGFLLDLKADLTCLQRRAMRGERIAVRLNVLSDLPWERLIDMTQCPDIRFYDYTPNPVRMIAYIDGNMPANYALTFSRKEDNSGLVDLVMTRGGNVATVFAGSLPKQWCGRQVVDGDESDLRFLDPRGVIVGLRAKGKAKRDDSGFVVR